MAVKSFSRFLFGIVAVCLWAGHMLEAQAAPEPITDSLIRRQSADDKLVFAYFIVRVTSWNFFFRALEMVTELTSVPTGWYCGKLGILSRLRL